MGFLCRVGISHERTKFLEPENQGQSQKNVATYVDIYTVVLIVN